ncbi:unnamed protein product [Anisakis simplex]|uniref:EB domain-containing protein n=1 Tax=Anisakis simplex TaxID=6269 RepID=A0A0M3JNE7_ANISI|nr:unnamed protein product [Anisakis simplex]
MISVYPGSRCNITDKCQLNSKCLNGSCVCPEQFDTSASGFCTNATSKTIKKGLAGSHCSANSSCASSTLLCSSSEHCICSDGFIGDGHGDCSKIAKPFARSSSLPQFTEGNPSVPFHFIILIAQSNS